MNEPAFKTTLLGPNIPVEIPPRTIQLLPTELYILPEGSTENKPSLALILTTGNSTPVVVAQLSVKMLIESMDTPTRKFLISAVEQSL